MKPKEIRKLIEPFRVENGRKFRLKDIDPNESGSKGLEGQADALLAEGIARMRELQARLYAQNEWSLLLIFQAMDAAGKDGTIKHVMGGIDPTGVQVFSFKQPSTEELDHDFMWRCLKSLPERGRIGIFNRSYYEETLVVRVHPELLAKQHLPPQLVTKDIWHERFADIRHYEKYLTRNGVIVRKFFLNISKAEQKRRFLARLDDPAKHWKFSAADLRGRELWDDYMNAYEDMIQHTATEESPWFVVPADNKWFTRAVVSAAVTDALASLDLKYPKVDEAQLKELASARAQLQRKK